MIINLSLIGAQNTENELFKDDLEQPWNIKSSKEALEYNLQIFIDGLSKTKQKDLANELNKKYAPIALCILPNSFPQKKELNNATHQLAKKTQSLNETLVELLEKQYHQLSGAARFYLLIVTAQTMRATIQKPHRPKTWSSLEKQAQKLSEKAAMLSGRFTGSPCIKPLLFLEKDHLIKNIQQLQKSSGMVKFDPKETIQNLQTSIQNAAGTIENAKNTFQSAFESAKSRFFHGEEKSPHKPLVIFNALQLSKQQ